MYITDRKLIEFDQPVFLSNNLSLKLFKIIKKIELFGSNFSVTVLNLRIIIIS